MIKWVLNHPFATLAVPPALLILQFLVLILLFRVGLPESMTETHGKASLLIWILFSLSLPSIPTLLLAVRQVFLLPNKIAPSLGILANGAYFLGFISFFVFGFVLRTFT